MNGAADRHHLQLDGVEPQLLYRASAAKAAAAYESDRLVAPFSVGVVARQRKGEHQAHRNKRNVDKFLARDSRPCR